MLIENLKSNKKMETLTFDQMPMAINQLLDRAIRIESLLSKPTEPPKSQRFDFNGLLSYLNESGYTYSKSQLQKATASGSIPCKKFNNRLVFEQHEIDAWVKSETVSVGDNSGRAALELAKSANNKLKGHKV